MPTYNERLQTNNAELASIKQTIDNLPKAGTSDAKDIAATVPSGLPPETAKNVQAVLDALDKKPSGGEGKWELIEVIDLKSPEMIVRNKEPNGTPYNFKAVKIKSDGSIPKQSFFLSLKKLPNEETSYTVKFLAKGDKPYRVLEIHQSNGYWDGYSAYGTAKTVFAEMLPLPYEAQLGKFTSASPDAFPTVKEIAVDRELKVGEKMEIWAVRA